MGRGKVLGLYGTDPGRFEPAGLDEARLASSQASSGSRQCKAGAAKPCVSCTIAFTSRKVLRIGWGFAGAKARLQTATT
jgi:hypothetical protein